MNPFKYGQVVGAKDFCPRPKLSKEIQNFIRTGQNIVVQGERRIGKTSLIFEVAKTFKKARICYIDLLEIKTINDLCKRIIKSIVSLEDRDDFLKKMLKSFSNLKPALTLDPITEQPAISIDSTVKFKPESIEGLFDLILELHEQKALILIFDEFQGILKLKEKKEALAILRSKIQFHSSIPYIFAGSLRNEMDRIFNHPESSFFKSAISINVGPIEESYFISFLNNKFSKGSRTVVSSLFDTIFRITENITGDIQQLCEAIWETTSYGEHIDEKIIPKALNLIYSRECRGYEAILVNLTDIQLKCLVGLAKMGGKSVQSRDFLHEIGYLLPGTVRKSLIRLEKLKIIFKYEAEYRFVNPFFKSWLIFKDF